MKKKIGIMSMQRIVNYGSFLQAFGLKTVLEDLGYDVQFVDYKFERIVAKLENKTIFQKIIKNINVIQFVKKKKILNEFRKRYNLEFLKLLGISEYNYNPDIDGLVIGSDEVFNCLQDYPVGYSRELFGKNYENIDVISYAGSFGHTKVEQLKDYKIDEEIKDMLSRFKAISVRDNNSYNIVKELTKKEPILHLDPVLISSYDNYITNNLSLKDFIIIYAYTGRLTSQEEKTIKSFAKKNNKIIISLGMYQRIADKNLVVSPFEVLEYFQKADYVITDTFHGTIFSIINHSNFCTIIRESNSNKLNYLLDLLQLKTRKVKKIDDIERLFNESIDYSDTDKIILKEREKSIKYLKDNLK